MDYHIRLLSEEYKFESCWGYPRLFCAFGIFENVDEDMFKVIFDDERKHTINLDGNKSPEFVYIPASDKPSFNYENSK